MMNSWTVSNSEVLVQTADNTIAAGGEIGVGASVLTSKWVTALQWAMLARIPTLWVTAPRASSTSLVMSIDEDLGLNDITEAGDTVRFESVESLDTT